MLSSLSTTSNHRLHDSEPAGFDFEADRDLIALMNESRNDYQLQAATQTARARLRRRMASSSGNRRTMRRAIAAPLHSLANALEGTGEAPKSIKRR